jgi:hypothetical protein
MHYKILIVIPCHCLLVLDEEVEQQTLRMNIKEEKGRRRIT